VTVYPAPIPLTPVTDQPVEVPPTLMSSAVRPVTASLNRRPKSIDAPPVGSEASEVNDATVGGVGSATGPSVAAMRLATAVRSAGNVE
jgi:hypothetical protein